MLPFLRPRLPIDEARRVWVDDSFGRLAGLLGVRRMMDARVTLPTPEHFPDRYDGGEAGVRTMFVRVAEALQVDPSSVVLELTSSAEAAASSLTRFGASSARGAAGTYVHRPGRATVITISEQQARDPMALVATIAHELGHVILLRPGLVAHDEWDMEPLNDLLMVFLGFGIFNANAAFQFHQFTDTDRQGWETKRLGYLSEEMFAYALARFAFERGEDRPAWRQHLARNLTGYFGRSLAWLKTNGSKVFQDTPAEKKVCDAGGTTW